MRLFAALFIALSITFAPAATGVPKAIKIGVLSHRGDAVTMELWTKTADYLSQALSGHWFSIVPLEFHEVVPAVASGSVDFVLVNPGIYVNLEVRYRVSRIATLNNRRGGESYNIFGGVVFTLADRDDIRTLDDLRGKRFEAVDATSLGGFQMAWGKLHDAGIEPYEDFAELEFAGTHDHVVLDVLEGLADAGTVRTDILERMAVEGTIRLADFRIINRQDHEEFPFVHSTALFPEWPFSKLQHTPNELAQKVAVALLNMPKDHPAALVGRYAGWTIPLDYQPVHDLFRDLHLPPYEHTRITLVDVLRYYWYWIVLGVGALLFTTFMSTWVLRLNRQLSRAKSCLEQQHNLILNSVADGIYGVDLQGNSTFMNRAMERITGWSAAEIIGRNQHEFLHHTRADGTPHPPAECPVYQTFRDNQLRYVDDDVFWRRDGSSFPVEYTSNPVTNGGGDVIGAVVVFRDTTERKQAEERLRKHQTELAHVTRLSTMGEMASNIAHELNQPLSAVANYSRGCIRMLNAGNAEPEQLKEAMERVARQAERAGEIIRQLRHFIRKDPPKRTVIDLNRRIHDLAVLIDPDARREGVKLRLALEPREPRVVGHGIQIEQVIVNLARNAIEAMQETSAGSRLLTIRTSIDGHEAVVTVSDTGPGFAAEILDKLFEPFVTTKAQGMGLGLSISRGIIEAHGGTLSVAATSAEGTTFRFTLPLHGDAHG